MSKPLDEALALRKELKQRIKKGNPSGLCHFALTYIDDLTNANTVIKTANACYAALRSMERYDPYSKNYEWFPCYKNLTAFVDFSFNIVKEGAMPFKEEYTDWVLRESPYKDAFAVQDAEDVLKNGAIINLDVPAQYALGALVCLRYLKEHPVIVKGWEKFRHMDGMNKNKAFVLASNYYFMGDKINAGFYSGNTNHQIGPGMTAFGWNNFLTYSPIFKGLEPLFVHTNYMRFVTPWIGKDKKGKKLVTPQAGMVNIYKEDGWGFKYKDQEFVEPEKALAQFFTENELSEEKRKGNG